MNPSETSENGTIMSDTNHMEISTPMAASFADTNMQNDATAGTSFQLPHNSSSNKRKYESDKSIGTGTVHLEECDTKRTKVTTNASDGVAAASLSIPWSELSLDYIETIAEFMSVRELPLLLRTCCTWKSVVSKIRTRNKSMTINYRGVSDLVSWSHRRWVSYLIITPRDRLDSDRSIQRTELVSIKDHLSLTSLECAIKIPSGRGTPLPFNENLRSLKVHLWIVESLDGFHASDSEWMESNELFWNGFRTLIEGVGALRRLETLAIFFEDALSSDLPMALHELDIFDPLLSLASTLSSFHMDGYLKEFAPDHIAVFRQLVNLKSFNFRNGHWYPQELGRFLELLGTESNLEYINIDETELDATTAEALSHLPALTSLEPGVWSTNDLSSLVHMKNLRCVNLTWPQKYDDDDINPPEPKVTITALSQCTLLENLQLEHDGLTDEHLRLLLTPLTKLRELYLLRMESLKDLTCLSSVPHLALKLEKLELCSLTTLPHTSIDHIRSLHKLVEMGFVYSFSVPLTLEIEGTLTPGNISFDRINFPQLKSFKFRDPRQDRVQMHKMP